MSIYAKRCHWVTCDGGTNCDPWEDVTPHFDTADEAIDYIRGYGWIVAGDKTLCPDCAAKADCAATGHQWPDEWHHVEQLGVAYRYRYCEHCNSTQHEPPFNEICVLIRAAEALAAVVEPEPDGGGPA